VPLSNPQPQPPPPYAIALGVKHWLWRAVDYDDIMRAACTRAALAEPHKYPAGCDAVLRQMPPQSPTDPFACEGNVDDPVAQAACSD